MLAVYLCLISVLTPLVSSKWVTIYYFHNIRVKIILNFRISLLSFGGKTYLNGQYIVEAPDNGNIKDGIYIEFYLFDI